jgi:hypothetical protein
MAKSAALLVDEVFPEQPVRQWVLSVPYPLRFLFARRPEVVGWSLGMVYRCITAHLIKKVGVFLFALAALAGFGWRRQRG